MSVLALEQVSLGVESAELLNSVSAHIVKGQVCALVGPNGCGKSTLLRAIATACGAREAEEDDAYFLVGSGTVSGSAAEGRCVLVEQDALQWSDLLAGGTEEELRALPLSDAIDMGIAEMDEDAEEDAEVWRTLCLAAGDTLGWDGARYEETPLGDLSPGCAVRAYLAIALHRCGLDLLLLDEPTNHLDLSSILWLQAAIRASGKSMLIVSHNAAFLDTVCDHVWAIDPLEHTLAVSGASYSDFRASEEAARLRQVALYESQQRRNTQLTAAAKQLRSRSAAGASCVGKDNDTMLRDFRRDRAGRSGRKAKALEKIRDKEPTVELAKQRKPLRITIDPLGAGHDSAIMFQAVSIGHDPETPLPLPPLTCRIDFGERVAIVGDNGVGKSTFLATLTGALEPISGSVSIGRELRLGNLMQEHENLPRTQLAKGYVAELAGLTTVGACRHLIHYGLTLQQAESPISTLNPGARARLLLAGFALRKVNTLILDEPTNHLDAEAIGELIATLNSFSGTVVLVTHSLEFLTALDLTRVLRLQHSGLSRVDSVEVLVEDMEEAVAGVIAKVWG
ncbi:hypothetical protein KIPB_009050 [Kipferlia bialata]|uniref:ABC transporter domain-containing protein n=1 Tax=Kipferlia bialata TaxID=797122 RepID=A0A9K3D314_9EUKA|nr:hypothetical protein KIPB_009050 [Kipferlia bialata]|eukprot:g9050.t1